MLSALKFSNTKNPARVELHPYVMFDLEDMDGSMRCILWPEDLPCTVTWPRPTRIVAVRGCIDKRPGSEEANLIVNELRQDHRPPRQHRPEGSRRRPLVVGLKATLCATY